MTNLSDLLLASPIPAAGLAASVDEIAAANATAADWSNNAHKITSVADPTLAQDAATKAYVDAHAGSGTVTDVTSSDSSLTVTNPTTTPDLVVAVVDGGSA